MPNLTLPYVLSSKRTAEQNSVPELYHKVQIIPGVPVSVPSLNSNPLACNRVCFPPEPKGGWGTHVTSGASSYVSSHQKNLSSCLTLSQQISYKLCKSGRSANEFHKSQIRKFADFYIFFRYAELPQMWQFSDLRTIYSLRFEDLRICGLAHLRNLQFWDCEMSPRVCGFACPPLKL